MGVSTTGDVAAGSMYRNEFLACNQTGRKFSLKFLHAGKLGLGKFFNSVICKVNIVPCTLRKAFPCRRNFFRSDDDVTRPLIEIFGIFTSRLFATVFNFGEHVLDNSTGIFFASCGRLVSFF